MEPPNDHPQRRRLNLTTAMVKKAMAVKHLGFTEAVKWLIEEYRAAFTPEYQDHLVNIVNRHTREFIKKSAIPAWVTVAEAEDEMRRWFFIPVLNWYRGKGTAPSPLIAYYAEAPHATAHLMRWAGIDARMRREPMPEYDIPEKPQPFDLDDLPEPIREYGRLRADGFSQRQCIHILHCSAKHIAKLEKWTRRFLLGEYDDDQCRLDLQRGKPGRPKWRKE